MNLWYVFAPDFSRVGAIERISNMRWTRRWNKAGAFELEMPFDAESFSTLKCENLIIHNNDIGIIEYVRVTMDDAGETIVCGGRFAAAYAERRIALAAESQQAPIETIMLNIATANMTGDNRGFENLEIAESRGRGETIEYAADNKTVLQTFETLAEQSGLGFDITKTASGVQLRVIEGKDRTANQSANSRAIFSREFENIYSQEYEIDIADYRNVAVNGNGEYGMVTGRERREVYISTGDDDSATEEQKAAEALADAKINESFSVEADPHGNLIYKVDYDLGDLVTVASKRWGLQVDTRITEITENYKADGFELEITFGEKETLKKMIGGLLNG